MSETLVRCIWSVIVSVVGASLALAEESPLVHHYFSKTLHEPVAEWGYHGAIGPGYWGSLDPSYEIASTGEQQSPIDLNGKTAQAANLPVLMFHYRPEQIAVFNSGHSIQHQGDMSSYFTLGDEQYLLEQFHAHTPSEHTLNGDHFPGELHFVHKSASGKVIVVAVFVVPDQHSRRSSPLIDDLPQTAGEHVLAGGVRNLADFLPGDQSYFSYQGSFTTPPCTEGVRWIVLREPIGVKPELVRRFAAILKGNNRPIQELHQREVLRSR